MIVSIIICTCNRAEHLRQTLASLEQIEVPAHLPTETIVVDNASTDHTPDVVCAGRLTNMPLRYVHEPRQGQSYARNAGLEAAEGDLILFTDDDVRLPRGWIAGMTEPLVSGAAQAVAGGVALAPALLRPWMLPIHKNMLASTEQMRAHDPLTLIGANMAFLRSVLKTVPGFNPELGPGTRFGGGDDALFSFQLRQAGFHLTSRLDVAVEHHFEPSRLSRAGFRDRMTRYGRELAYLAHHWEHRDIPLPHLRLLKNRLQWARGRLDRRRAWHEREGMAEWEMLVIRGISFYQQYLIERKRPRSYEQYGLVKRG